VGFYSPHPYPPWSFVHIVLTNTDTRSWGAVCFHTLIRFTSFSFEDAYMSHSAMLLILYFVDTHENAYAHTVKTKMYMYNI
jgi:hypothetical protein